MCLLLQDMAKKKDVKAGEGGTAQMLLEKGANLSAMDNVSIALGCLVLCWHCPALALDLLLSGSALNIAYVHACLSVCMACLEVI